MAWLPARILQDSAHRGTSADMHILLFGDHRQKCIACLCLGADHASETLAESAVDAAQTMHSIRIGVGRADGGGRNRVGMKSKRLSGRAKHLGQMRHLHGRRRILPTPLAVEWIASRNDLALDVARYAGHTQKTLGPCVVRFEFSIGNSPVSNISIFRKPFGAIFFERTRAQFEKIFICSNAHALPMFARASKPRAGEKGCE